MGGGRGWRGEGGWVEGAGEQGGLATCRLSLLRPETQETVRLRGLAKCFLALASGVRRAILRDPFDPSCQPCSRCNLQAEPGLPAEAPRPPCARRRGSIPTMRLLARPAIVLADRAIDWRTSDTPSPGERVFTGRASGGAVGCCEGRQGRRARRARRAGLGRGWGPEGRSGPFSVAEGRPGEPGDATSHPNTAGRLLGCRRGLGGL